MSCNESHFRTFYTYDMRITVKTGIVSALGWMLLKLAFYVLGIFEHSIVPTVLLNILGLLLAIVIGLFIQKRRETEETNALVDMKNAMSAGLPYVILVGVFIYLFYAKINPSYIEHQIAENDSAIEKMVHNPDRLKKFRKQNADADVMSPELIEKRLKESNRKGASAGFTATLATLALLILSTIYSLLVTIIYRQLLFKRIYSSRMNQ